MRFPQPTRFDSYWGKQNRKNTEMSSTITIKKNEALFVIAGSIGALIGLLLGCVIFSRPALSPATIPPVALDVAYKAGSLILQGAATEDLPMDVFTDTFLSRYPANYAAFVRPMSTTDIAWTGIPVVTLNGNNFIDVCLIAQTRAGILAIELRLVRNGATWAVDQLLSLQLRKAN
jgi:hypothetical protein